MEKIGPHSMRLNFHFHKPSIQKCYISVQTKSLTTFPLIFPCVSSERCCVMLRQKVVSLSSVPVKHAKQEVGGED